MKWEYKTVKLPTKGLLGLALDQEKAEQQLNELGRMDWELVAAIREQSSNRIVAVLKRAR